MYIANSSLNDVLVFATSANGNVAPLRHISGSNTELSSPQGVTIH
jgi:hypothetical protein